MRSFQTFLHCVNNFSFLSKMCKCSSCSTISPIFDVAYVFILDVLVRMYWYQIVVLNCMSLMTDDVEHVLVFWAIDITIFMKCLFRSLHIFIVCCIHYWVVKFIYQNSGFCQTLCLKFSPDLWLADSFLTMWFMSIFLVLLKLNY